MFSAGRRRVIIILLVTSMILITLDLRGNTVFNAARTGFGYAMSPFELAGEVIAGPIERTWAGITEVDDLRAENRELRETIDAQRADQVYAQSAIIDNNELKDLIGITQFFDYERVPASIIGDSPSNFDQKVEIDVGTRDGVRVGMQVINSAGLVGNVTQAYLETSVVKLVTDPTYFVRVKVVGQTGEDDEATSSTTPSGIPLDELDVVANELTPTSVPDGTVPSDSSVAGDAATSVPTETSVPAESSDTSVPDDGSTTTTTTTTTTIPPEDVIRETGQLHGYGGDRLPRIEFVADAPQFGRIRPGDAILTAGGRLSLAPPDIPVGTVHQIMSTNSSEGLQLEVNLNADLNQLNFLEVVLYQPPTELPE